MILIHKETSEIYEVLIRSISDDPYFNLSTGHPLGEIVLSNSVLDCMPSATYGSIADHFEILGWL